MNKLYEIKNIIESKFPGVINISSILKNTVTIVQEDNFIILNSVKLKPKIYIISIGKVSQHFAFNFINFLRSKNINYQKVIIVNDKKYLTEDTIENSQDYEIFISNHPELTLKSIENTKEIIEFLKSNDSEDSCFIFLISGGGSSLFEYPLISPNLAIEIYKHILNLDIDIYQMNTVRRFFSKVKSGKILQYLKNSQIVSLILSDVPFNDLSTIASGITYLKKFSQKEIEFISQILKPLIDHYNIHQTLRENFQIFNQIENSNTNLENIHHFILADNTLALKELEKLFIENGFNTETIFSHLNLKIDKLVELIISIIKTNLDKNSKLYLMGGETNLRIEKDGFGGRLQHLGLKILKEIKNIQEKEIIFFAFSTDGVDGKTNKAGCIISNKIPIEIEKIEKYLENFNSGLFFENPKNQKFSLSLPPGINNLNEIYGIYLM